jgi:hypothetical protein
MIYLDHPSFAEFVYKMAIETKEVSLIKYGLHWYKYKVHENLELALIIASENRNVELSKWVEKNAKGYPNILKKAKDLAYSLEIKNQEEIGLFV